MFEFLSKDYLRADAKRMADSFLAECPPKGTVGGKAVSDKRISSSLDRLYAEATRLSKEKRLGVLGRARLARALQDELRGHGYPPDLVSKVVGAVTVNALVAAPHHRG